MASLPSLSEDRTWYDQWERAIINSQRPAPNANERDVDPDQHNAYIDEKNSNTEVDFNTRAIWRIALNGLLRRLHYCLPQKLDFRHKNDGITVSLATADPTISPTLLQKQSAADMFSLTALEWKRGKLVLSLSPLLWVLLSHTRSKLLL
jgi:hypothetical protein